MPNDIGSIFAANVQDMLRDRAHKRGTCRAKCDRTQDSLVLLSKPCPMCGKHNEIYTTRQQWHDYWCDKQLIQDVFPDLTVDQRETVKSGLCNDCWAKVFPDED